MEHLRAADAVARSILQSRNDVFPLDTESEIAQKIGRFAAQRRICIPVCEAGTFEDFIGEHLEIAMTHAEAGYLVGIAVGLCMAKQVAGGAR